MARAPRPTRIRSCNVVVDVAGQTRLWSFLGAEVRPAGSLEQPSEWPLPAKLIGKGWRQLVRPQSNVAWIAEQRVFVQLVHLPTNEPSEVPAMLELQVEKLSPVPIGQVVWSYEVLPQRTSSGLCVLVFLAVRSEVEAMLGSLERRGFRTDRIESPLVTLVVGTEFADDGAYLFILRFGTRRTCLIGWVAEGALRLLNTVNLAEDDRWSRQLADEFDRLAWAGELEGWVTGPPKLHLVADDAVLKEWLGPIEMSMGTATIGQTRPGDRELASASAKRAMAASGQSNLLPPEFATRYRQEYTDRLWMGGLGALFAAYLVAVLIYFGAVEIQKYRQDRIADALAEVNTAYTNTLRLKAQAQVLQETVNLRYAALDCWLATVEAMPEELSLETMTFSGGQSMTIGGTAPADQEPRITEFWQALRRKVVGNTNLFSDVTLRPTVLRTVQGSPQIQWSFTCRIQRTEI